MNRNLFKILGVSAVLSFFFLGISAFALKNVINENPDPVLVFDGKPYQVTWNSNSEGVTISRKNDTKQGTENYDYSTKIQSLDLEGVAADWKFEVVDGSTFKIEAKGRPSKKDTRLLEIKEQNGSLKIIADKDSEDLTVRLQIPGAGLQDVNLRTISGNVEIPKMIVESFQFKGVSGDLKLNATQLQKLQFKSISGNLEVEGVIFRDVNAESVSGDFQGTVASDFAGSWKSISGDFEIKFSQKPAMEFKVKTISGKIQSAVPLTNNSKNILEVKTTSGDIEIE